MQEVCGATAYLCNDVGRFPEVLTPADAGARQKVFDESHANVVAPEEEEKTMKVEMTHQFLTCTNTLRLDEDSKGSF